MTVREYLSQIRRLDDAIAYKEEQRKEILEEMASIRAVEYDKDKVQASASGDQMINLMIRLEEIAGEADEMRKRFFEEKNTIINQITALEKHTTRDLLYKRYVEYKSFEVISVEMGYAYEYARALHGEALKDFAEMYFVTSN